MSAPAPETQALASFREPTSEVDVTLAGMDPTAPAGRRNNPRGGLTNTVNSAPAASQTAIVLELLRRCVTRNSALSHTRRDHTPRYEPRLASQLCRRIRAWRGPVLTCLCWLPELMNVVSATNSMTDRVYTFVKSPEQLRRLGARGGRAFARNQRARRALLAARRQTLPPRAASYPTAAESIAVLDACFPWLRGAEKRLS